MLQFPISKMKYTTIFTCDIIHGFLWGLLMLVKRSWKRVCLLGGPIHGRSLAEDGFPEKMEYQVNMEITEIST